MSHAPFDQSAAETSGAATEEYQLLLAVHEGEALREHLLEHVRPFLREDCDLAAMQPLVELLRTEKEHWIIAIATANDTRREEHMSLVRAAQSALDTLFAFCRLHASDRDAWVQEEDSICRTFVRAREAAGALMEMHVLFVRRLAHRHAKRSHLEHDDLVAEGMCGLLRAIREYDVARGTTLLTHAAYRIRAAMSTFEERQLRSRLHEVQLAQYEDGEERWAAIPDDHDGERTTPLEQLVLEEERDEQDRLYDAMQKCLASLRPAQRAAVRAIHGFDDGVGMSNGEYGRRHSISRTAARDLLQRGHAALRLQLQGMLSSKTTNGRKIEDSA